MTMLNMFIKNFCLPMPSNIYYWWNFGSLLGFCFLVQLSSGVFLSMFYENSILYAFDGISQMERNISYGWFIRSLHANGASLFFMLVYFHMSRGLYFKSFSLKKVWISGVVMLMVLFMIAFIGYVLPWGQMSFWGATVITNLLTSVPYVGDMMTIWLWGNYSVSKATLMRFFSFHFLMPFLLMALIFMHILFLHSKGSNNPLGVIMNLDKIPFQPYFFWKDLMGVFFVLNIFLGVVLLFPYLLMDPDNFMPANPLNTPEHIQPEWYFLFAYAILRTIPNKLGGVLALMFSILIFGILPFFYSYNNKVNNFDMKIVSKLFYFFWVINFFYLIMMGSMVIEYPYIELSRMVSFFYFLYFFIYI